MGLVYIVKAPDSKSGLSLKHAVKPDGKTFCGKRATDWSTVYADIEEVSDSCVICYHIIVKKEAKYVG